MMEADGRNPPGSFFVLETGRGGSTLLAQILATHPEIGWASELPRRLARMGSAPTLAYWGYRADEASPPPANLADRGSAFPILPKQQHSNRCVASLAPPDWSWQWPAP